MNTAHTPTQVTLFVYYKLPLSEHAQWVGRVRDFQQAVVQAWPGMTVELMQRPEASPEGLETWMEVYRHPQGVSPEMMASVAALAQAYGLPPKRAAELFVPLH
jgi:Domain of unknown function (DUF4936)